jgi:hypothetical protein
VPVPAPSRVRLTFPILRDVADALSQDRDLIERAIFVPFARQVCEKHARYSIDGFVLKKRPRGPTILHATRCCPQDDDYLSMAIELAPLHAAQHRDRIVEMTSRKKGAAWDLDAEAAFGFRRRRRKEAVTLESTLILSGVERMNDVQVARLRELIDAAGAKRRLACSVHRRTAIEAVHVVQEKDATVVDLVMCCAQTNDGIMVVQALVDDALLSGPVVAISAGKWTKKKR